MSCGKNLCDFFSNFINVNLLFFIVEHIKKENMFLYVYMKILRIHVKGIKLFEKELKIDFYAKQRVNTDKNEMLTNVFSNIYITSVYYDLLKNQKYNIVFLMNK